MEAWLRIIVIGLAVTYVMTFLGGFLQATPLNFLNYLFFALLCAGGIALMGVTMKSEAVGLPRVALLLTAASSVLLLILFVGYEYFRENGFDDLERSIEGARYLITLFFWIGVIGSLFLTGRIGTR
jgi:hypothetical protein